MKKYVLLLIAFYILTFCMFSCAPDVVGKCFSNEECIENHLCNKKNQCVAVEQEKLEILNENLDYAIVGKQYSLELSLRGGLPPYTWSKTEGPTWLNVENDDKTGNWRLTGVSDAYQNDGVLVKIEVSDNSIGDGQKTIKDNLSIRSLYCLESEEPAEACSGNGICNIDGVCKCIVSHAGNQCDECNTEGGYELNENQECVRYEYKCDNETCGADVMRRECMSDDCESVEWTSHDDCTADMICRTTGAGPSCIDCGTLHGCSEEKCQGCDPG